MATSDRSIDQRPARRSGLARYDFVLIVIPLALTLGLLTGYLLSVPLEASLAGASLLGMAVLADALFLNPPRPREN